MKQKVNYSSDSFLSEGCQALQPCCFSVDPPTAAPQQMKQESQIIPDAGHKDRTKTDSIRENMSLPSPSHLSPHQPRATIAIFM